MVIQCELNVLLKWIRLYPEKNVKICKTIIDSLNYFRYLDWDLIKIKIGLYAYNY